MTSLGPGDGLVMEACYRVLEMTSLDQSNFRRWARSFLQGATALQLLPYGWQKANSRTIRG